MNKFLQSVFALIFCFISASVYSQDIVMKAGDLTNNLGTIPGYVNWTPISSFQMGMEAETSWTKGGGAAVGKPNPGAIEITKAVDAFSNQLAILITQGKSIPKLEIVWLLSNGSGDRAVAHKVELGSVFITSLMNSAAEGCASGSGNCPPAAESFKLVYKTLKRTIFTQQRDGTYKEGTTFTWDVAAGTSSL